MHKTIQSVCISFLFLKEEITHSYLQACEKQSELCIVIQYHLHLVDVSKYSVIEILMKPDCIPEKTNHFLALEKNKLIYK